MDDVAGAVALPASAVAILGGQNRSAASPTPTPTPEVHNPAKNNVDKPLDKPSYPRSSQSFDLPAEGRAVSSGDVGPDHVSETKALPSMNSLQRQDSNTSTGQSSENRVSAYARLDFESGTFYVQTLQVLLGRHPKRKDVGNKVDVDLGNTKAISRVHARIFYNFGSQRFEISILGRNGAFLDDTFVEMGSTVPLRDGTRIQIGQIPFTFTLPSNADSAPNSDSEEQSRARSSLHRPSAGLNANSDGISRTDRSATPVLRPEDALSLRGSGVQPASSTVIQRSSSSPRRKRRPSEATTISGSPKPPQDLDNSAMSPPLEDTNASISSASIQHSQKQPTHPKVKPPKPPPIRPEDIPEQYRQKPTVPYTILVIDALRAHPGSANGLSLSEIYRMIQELYPYYKYCPPGWQNSVRHNLSLNKSFRKISKEGKGFLWGLNEDVLAEKERKRKASAEAAAAAAAAATAANQAKHESKKPSVVSNTGSQLTNHHIDGHGQQQPLPIVHNQPPQSNIPSQVAASSQSPPPPNQHAPLAPNKAEAPTSEPVAAKSNINLAQLSSLLSKNGTTQGGNQQLQSQVRALLQQAMARRNDASSRSSSHTPDQGSTLPNNTSSVDAASTTNSTQAAQVKASSPNALQPQDIQSNSSSTEVKSEFPKPSDSHNNTLSNSHESKAASPPHSVGPDTSKSTPGFSKETLKALAILQSRLSTKLGGNVNNSSLTAALAKTLAQQAKNIKPPGSQQEQNASQLPSIPPPASSTNGQSPSGNVGSIEGTREQTPGNVPPQQPALNSALLAQLLASSGKQNAQTAEASIPSAKTQAATGAAGSTNNQAALLAAILQKARQRSDGESKNSSLNYVAPPNNATEASRKRSINDSMESPGQGPESKIQKTTPEEKT